MSRSLHCPACAGPLPPIDAQEIVTCEFCGTDVNADLEAEPGRPARSPPLSGKREWSDPDDPMDRWEAGVFVHALLSPQDPTERLRIARTSNGHFGGADSAVWLPALLDAADDAERGGHTDLALELALWAFKIAGGSPGYLYRGRDGREPGEPPRIAEFRWGGRRQTGGYADEGWEARAARILLERVEARDAEFPGSHVTLVLVAGVGVSGLKALVDLGGRAEARGDTPSLGIVLEAMRRMFVDEMDDELCAVLLDMHTWLIGRSGGRVRERLITTLCDLADLHYDEPGEQYPQEWRGPEDYLGALLAWVEDLLHEDAPLAREALGRIAAMHDRSGWWRGRHIKRWRDAIAVLGTAEGRGAAIDAFEQVFGPPPVSDEGSADPTPDLRAELPPLRAATGGVKLARARSGQAPCPSCGRAIGLGERRIIAVCDHCGQAARIAREARLIKRKEHAGLAVRLQEWSPERLVQELLATGDPGLRAAILDELAAATTDGARYAELAPALVAYMLADIPRDVEDRLGDGIKRMLQHQDPGFREALFNAIRTQAFTEEGSDRLLLALESAGAAAAPLLLDLCDKVTEDQDAWAPYALRAKQVAADVLHRCDESELEGHVEFLLGRMQHAKAALSDDLATTIGALCFGREQPVGAAQRRVVLFIDELTDPAKITWMKGHAHHAPDLSRPDYSWTAEDIADAERRTGLTWAQGGELDTQRILMAVPTLPGSLVSLRQVQMLMSQVEQWHAPETAQEFIDRLRLAGQCRKDSTRAIILDRMTERPSDMDGEQEATARTLLSELRGSPEVTGWVEFVERVLTIPGHARAAAAENAAAWRPPRQLGLLARLKCAWGTRK